MVTAATVGTDTVGSGWLTLGNGPVYLQSGSVQAESWVVAVVAHLRHPVANVPSLGAYVLTDDDGEPGVFVSTPSENGNAILMTSTGRWFTFPVGLWVPDAATFWYGISMSGNTSLDLARETTGGDGGSLASQSEAATWTSGSNDYSMYLRVLS